MRIPKLLSCFPWKARKEAGLSHRVLFHRGSRAGLIVPYTTDKREFIAPVSAPGVGFAVLRTYIIGKRAAGRSLAAAGRPSRKFIVSRARATVGFVGFSETVSFASFSRPPTVTRRVPRYFALYSSILRARRACNSLRGLISDWTVCSTGPGSFDGSRTDPRLGG